MTKSVLPNFKNWDVDERRLLVIFLLTLIYPVFVSSFFALYIFVLLPVMLPLNFGRAKAHHEGWYHMYWLFVTSLWVVLCTLILPRFKKEKVPQMMNLANVESSTLLPVKVEVKDKDDSSSNLSQKSDNSTDNIKKATSDLESERESLLKSKESLNKSSGSLDKRFSESGDFLNDCMSTICPEDGKQNETVCDIHAEESDEDDIRKPKDHESDKEAGGNDSKKDEDDKVRSDLKGESTKEPVDKNKKENGKKHSDASSENLVIDVEAEQTVSAQKTKAPQTSSPLKINEAVLDQQEDSGELEMAEEVDKLDSDNLAVKRGKARPSVDTSRASGYYECSMPTLKSAEMKGSQNNTVFLFINPETGADTEDSILVSHGGEVEESEGEKTESSKGN